MYAIRSYYEKGEYFKQKLIQLQNTQPDIVDIRARGLMIAIELNTTDLADYIYNQLIPNGFLVGFKEETIRFMPPLIIERKDIDNLIDTIDKVITGTQQ